MPFLRIQLALFTSIEEVPEVSIGAHLGVSEFRPLRIWRITNIFQRYNNSSFSSSSSSSMDRPGIKHWHWRTKGVEPWAKEWFIKELTGTEANGVSIDKVTDVEGDCELGMRKSKLVTIYDQKITMRWIATDSTGTKIQGTLVAVEVSHDMDEDDYVFTSSVEGAGGKESDAFHSTAKKALANKLRAKFQQFPKAIIDTHGKDLLSEEGDSSAPGSGASTPSGPGPAKSTSSVPAASTTTGTKAPAPFNTAVVKAEAEYACTADDLFDFLTNQDKIPMWSRNPAKMKPEVGAEMSLFGGNIAGKVTEVSRPNKVVVDWRAPTWPEGYHGSLEMSLAQGSSSTTLALRLAGVPVGKEDEAERNLGIFYINGLKSIGSALSTTSFPPVSSSSRKRKVTKPPPPSKWSLVLTSAVPVSISLALIGGLITAFYYGPSGPGGLKT
ncbi:activator of Hsp90 ATPase [Meredithblackwellia eburnea MCA 4105]